jgi:hypothetical protein
MEFAKDICRSALAEMAKRIPETLFKRARDGRNGKEMVFTSGK